MEDVMSKKKCVKSLSRDFFNEIGKLEIEERSKKSSEEHADHEELADHDGWLICDGRELDREEYAELFAIIGTSYGAGDGKTTFNLPDFSDKMAGKYRIIKDGFIVAGAPQVAGCVKSGVFVPACEGIETVQPYPLYSQKKFDDEVESKVFIFAKKIYE